MQTGIQLTIDSMQKDSNNLNAVEAWITLNFKHKFKTKSRHKKLAIMARKNPFILVLTVVTGGIGRMACSTSVFSFSERVG